MLKKLNLATPFFAFFLFLEAILVAVGLYGVNAVDSFKDRTMGLAELEIPLTQAVSEIYSEQMDQAWRFGQIMQYAVTDQKERFDLAEEAFVHAGQRFSDFLKEARKITQRGVDAAAEGEVREQLSEIRTLLDEVEKIHGDSEHRGAAIVNSLTELYFQKGTEGEDDRFQNRDEKEKQFKVFLTQTVARMDEETQNLEDRLRKVSRLTGEMTATLANETDNLHLLAMGTLMPLIIIGVAGGILLALGISGLLLTSLRNPVGALADFMDEVNDASDKASAASVNMSNFTEEQRESLQLAAQFNASVEKLVDGNGDDAAEVKILLEKLGILIDHFNTVSTTLGGHAEQSANISDSLVHLVSRLNNTAQQVNMLATNASAESSKDGSAKAFGVFAEEIKELTRQFAANASEASALADTAGKNMNHGHSQAQEAVRNVAGMLHAQRQAVDLVDKVIQATKGQVERVEKIDVELSNLRRSQQAQAKEVDAARSATGTIADKTKTVTGIANRVSNFVGARRERRNR